MATLVSIIFNEDGQKWAEYLQQQMSENDTINAEVFPQQDTIVFGDAVDTRSETRIMRSSVILVLVTDGHIDFMSSRPQATYEKFDPYGEKGLMFLLGVTEELLEERKAVMRRIFPRYNAWLKVSYVDESNIKDLMEKVLEIIERPEPIQSKFSLIPTTMHCEQETTVAALIDKAVPEEAKVSAIVRGTYIDEELPCQRVNQYAYTFVMPKTLEAEATVYIAVDERSLGKEVTITFKSYINSSEQTCISEIYCHLLDKLFTFIRNEVKQSDITEKIDMKASEIFDHTIDLPAIGYEKLFGIYQYYVQERSCTMIPTLLHLAAKHNLKELMEHLRDLPYFSNALFITNKEDNTPANIALNLGFSDMAKFLKDCEEQGFLYDEMYYVLYSKQYQNMHGVARNTSDDYSPLEYSEYQACYMDMHGRPPTGAAGNIHRRRSSVRESSIYQLDLPEPPSVPSHQ